MNKFFHRVVVLLAVVLGVAATSAIAGPNDPLFIGLSSDGANRVGHVLHFAGLQMSRGHPVTIWLNEGGIFLASKKHTEKHAARQKELADLMSKGATVLVCQYCMKQLDVAESDLLPGFKMGDPDLVGGALFRDNTKTLTF
jgi:predicted peroxiredoxin